MFIRTSDQLSMQRMEEEWVYHFCEEDLGLGVGVVTVSTLWTHNLI